jgi:hypothetical protein
MSSVVIAVAGLTVAMSLTLTAPAPMVLACVGLAVMARRQRVAGR